MRPFPDDPNAERCAVTGGPAHARNAGGRIRGWYGSTVVDGSTIVALDPALPEGPLSDATLLAAIAAGRVYDPSDVLDGRVRLADVPDAVVAALAAFGAADALRSLDGGVDPDAGLHVPPVRHVTEDDPLTVAPSRGLFGHGVPGGVDLEGIGALMATVHRARGRPVDPAAIGAAVLARIRERAALDAELAQSLGFGKG